MLKLLEIFAEKEGNRLRFTVTKFDGQRETVWRIFRPGETLLFNYEFVLDYETQLIVEGLLDKEEDEGGP